MSVKSDRIINRLICWLSNHHNGEFVQEFIVPSHSAFEPMFTKYHVTIQCLFCTKVLYESKERNSGAV